MKYEFGAEVWLWKGNGPWHFVTVDAEVAARIREDRAGAPHVGWGSIPVSVTVGSATWKTSIFPDKKSGSYLLPMKAEVRKKENISASDTVRVLLSLQ